MVLFFYLKLEFLFITIEEVKLEGKKGTSHLALLVGFFIYFYFFIIIFQMFQKKKKLAHCFMFFNQMTIIYLTLESCWYIRLHTRISLCILGHICIFISNLFFYLLCERVTVFKNYLIDNLKDFIFVNVVKDLYLHFSIHIIFPWNVWKHHTRFNLLEFFHKWYKFIFYIVLHCLCWRLLA